MTAVSRLRRVRRFRPPPIRWQTYVRALLLMLGVPALTPSRAESQEHPIRWSLITPPTEITQGRTASVQLHAIIPAGWHLYSTTQPRGGPVPTIITVPAGSAFAMIGRVRAPEPDVAPDRNFELLTETYADSVTFVARVMARRQGATTLVLSVAYQTCTDRFCLPPMTESVEAPVTVLPPPPGTVIAELTPPTTPVLRSPDTATAPRQAAFDTIPLSIVPTRTLRTRQPVSTNTQSLPLFLWLAAVMGALSLLTPCVFPMIPITVSYFTRTSDPSRSAPARNALVYAGGIMATFTILGMAIAIAFGAGGINQFAANPWVNLLVTAIFVAFALNLFGLWQFTLPSALMTRLTAASGDTRRGETVGILAMGLTFTLTSFTCTAPFVGSLLVIAAQGNWQWPLLGLLVFSAVFALPFFLLALMPAAVARLPRSGRWMNTVKVMMGFLELATAMKFLANADMVWQWGVVTRDVVLIVWMVTSVAAAAYLAGLRFRGTPARPVSPMQRVLAVGGLGIALLLGRGLRGARMGELESFLPAPEGALAGGTSFVHGELSWIVNDYAGGLARAKAEHKLVLIDFTGYTCTNCRWMEANMFPRPEIAVAMDKFVRVRLYTDGQGDIYRAQQKLELDKFGTVALPYYAVVDASGTTQSQFLGMTRRSDEFLAFLRGTANGIWSALPILQ